MFCFRYQDMTARDLLLRRSTTDKVKSRTHAHKPIANTAAVLHTHAHANARVHEFATAQRNTCVLSLSSLSLSLSLALSFSVCLSVSVCLPLPVCLCLSVSACMSLSLCAYASLLVLFFLHMRSLRLQLCLRPVVCMHHVAFIDGQTLHALCMHQTRARAL